MVWALLNVENAQRAEPLRLGRKGKEICVQVPINAAVSAL